MIASQIPLISCSVYEVQPENVESRLTANLINKNNDRTETNSNPGEAAAGSLKHWDWLGLYRKTLFKRKTAINWFISVILTYFFSMWQ